MTKHCFRLLFLALTALLLAHGCGDGSLECLGTAVACENRDLSECSHGCRVQSGCVGSGPVSCESLSDNPTLCLQTPGCQYLGSCDGEAGCRELGYERCGETPGCTQVRRCAGSGVRCESLDDSQCELYPECALGSRCQGSATSCGALDSSSACQEVPGCYPADTTPAVVASSGVGS